MFASLSNVKLKSSIPDSYCKIYLTNSSCTSLELLQNWSSTPTEEAKCRRVYSWSNNNLQGWLVLGNFTLLSLIIIYCVRISNPITDKNFSGSEITHGISSKCSLKIISLLTVDCLFAKINKNLPLYRDNIKRHLDFSFEIVLEVLNYIVNARINICIE